MRPDRRPETVDAAGIDDVTFLRLLQHRQEGAGAVVDPAPAHIERLFPLLTAMGEHAAAPTDTGIVEEEMELVGAVTIGDIVAKSLDLRRLGHIGEMRGDPQALRQPRRLAQPPGFRHPFFRDVAHRNIASVGGQLTDELSPHSRAAAGDDRDPAREILHGSLLCGPVGSNAISCGGGRKGQAQRIRTISTPTSRLAQTRSAVTTGYPSLSPRAKQARSPSDRPACRVIERNRAAMRACGPSKGTTRKSIGDIASSA